MKPVFGWDRRVVESDMRETVAGGKGRGQYSVISMGTAVQRWYCTEKLLRSQ